MRSMTASTMELETALRNLVHGLQKPAVADRAELMRDPMWIATELPTAKAIEHHLLTVRAAQQAQREQVQHHEATLRHDVDALLHHVQCKEQQLVQLPDQIGTLEDALGELCAEMTVDRADGAQHEEERTTGRTEGEALLPTLTRQRQLLTQLEEVRDYLAVLAKAEELAQEAVKAEEQGQSTHALQHFTELCHLSKRIHALMDGSDDRLQAIGFVGAQRAQAFQALVRIRQGRLDQALTQAKWPPPPAELQLDTKVGSSSSSSSSPEQALRTSVDVRRSWMDVMMLQSKGEALGVIRPASARIPDQEALWDDDDGETTTVASVAPGSTAYQPLLAVQCLLQPLLLRFYYHFDSERNTNRLDKPEWYLNHMLSLIRSHANLFDPVKGVVAMLCNNVSRSRQRLRYDLSAELLHGILRPLSLKVESSIPLLLNNTQLMSHTIMQTVQFDQDLTAMLTPVVATTAPIYLADTLLSNQTVFEAWVQGERTFVSDRLNEELESAGAWLVGDENGVEEEGAQGSWQALAQDGHLASMEQGQTTGAPGDLDDGAIGIKTTRSAHAVVALLDGLSTRYGALPSISHQLPFLLIQLSLLQGYAQRLERSLDAFESLSSAFTRVIPGGVTGEGGVAGAGGDADMVRGLRGLGRLLKAGLSALYLSAHLSSLSAQSFFLLMGTSLATTGEGAKLMDDFRRWEGESEERELDHASLGDLIRRGWRSGGRLASGMRPLGTSSSNNKPVPEPTPTTAGTGTVDVWERPRQRFDALAQRALHGIERMIISEVLDGLRSYAQRDWNEEPEATNDDGTDGATALDVPTPSLVRCLSTLSMHLTHALPSLPRLQANRVYRTVAEGLSNALVDRIIYSGGAHRFSVVGAHRFQMDVQHGWLGVIDDVAQRTGRQGGTPSPLGARPHAPWGFLVDAGKLLSLTDKEDAELLGAEAQEGQTEQPTLQEACRAVFEPTMAGPSWEEVMGMLAIDDRMNIRVAREILRRRIDCPW